MNAYPTPRAPLAAVSPLLALHLATYRAAYDRLNLCRRTCPGIGGDVDAHNLACLLESDCAGEPSTVLQAANTLESLARGLDIDARAEVAALRALPLLSIIMDAGETLDALVCSRELDSTARPFRTVRNARNTIRKLSEV